MMLNRALRDILVGFKSDNVIMHDWAAALIAATVGEISYIDQTTVLYRQHDTNTIGARKEFGIFKKVVRAISSIQDFIKRQENFIEYWCHRINWHTFGKGGGNKKRICDSSQ